MNYWLMAGTASLVFLLTWTLRWYALTQHIIDVPKARSSHSVPTPRDGGMAIVASCLVATACQWLAE